MSLDYYSVLEACGLGCLFFWATGFSLRTVAAYRVRDQFRDKGYMQPPSGLQWLYFLCRRNYEVFDDGTARFFFASSRFCLMAMLAILTVILAIVGATVVFGMF